MLDSDLAFKFIPDKDEIPKCIDFGKVIARRVKGVRHGFLKSIGVDLGTGTLGGSLGLMERVAFEW